MSEADKDGRIAQMVYDMHACLSMSIHESLRKSETGLRGLLDEIEADHEAGGPPSAREGEGA